MDFQPKNKKGEPKKPRKYSIKEIKLADGTVIGVFEGDRGYKPDHDILISLIIPQSSYGEYHKR